MGILQEAAKSHRMGRKTAKKDDVAVTRELRDAHSMELHRNRVKNLGEFAHPSKDAFKGAKVTGERTDEGLLINTLKNAGYIDGGKTTSTAGSPPAMKGAKAEGEDTTPLSGSAWERYKREQAKRGNPVSQ